MRNRLRAMTFLIMLGLAALAQAQTFTTLYNFTNGSGGGWPSGAVIQDSSGNFYGNAGSWGPYDGGVVYEINPTGQETVLYGFTNGKDGGGPIGPLVRDSDGTLYGTTYSGGPCGCGVVFKVDAAGKETILHAFTGGSDGCYPQQGLVMDNSGVLFGTASRCGHVRRNTMGRGTIFKVDRAGNFAVLYTFVHSPDGGDPEDGHLTIDKSGNLYGTAIGGGRNQGVVYKLSKNGKRTLLHSFKGGTTDGCFPYGTVLQGEAGSLYGTTALCGTSGYGTIWELSKTGKETILHNFAGGTSDGCQPRGGLTRDSQGNLYGVTYECGTNNYGALYELSANGTYTVLHNFDESDGADSFAEVLRTTNGTLFGTSQEGGAYGWGTMWEYVP